VDFPNATQIAKHPPYGYDYTSRFMTVFTLGCDIQHPISHGHHHHL